MLRKTGLCIINSHISVSWEDCLYGILHIVPVSVLDNTELVKLIILEVSNIRTPKKLFPSSHTHTKKLEFPHTLPVSGHMAVGMHWSIWREPAAQSTGNCLHLQKHKNGLPCDLPIPNVPILWGVASLAAQQVFLRGGIRTVQCHIENTQ